MVTREELSKLIHDLAEAECCSPEKVCELCATFHVFKHNLDVAKLAIVNALDPDPYHYMKSLAAFFILGQQSVTNLKEAEILNKMFKEEER
jgi:hypothetical protein